MACPPPGEGLQAVILAGGLGSRLGSLTRDTPKPMLPVAGRPFLMRLIDEAARFDARRVLLLAGFRADVVREAFPGGVHRAPGATVAVETLAESEPLGTAGALRFAAGRLAPQFLMLNGDSFFGFNWLDLAAPLQGALGRIALRAVADASRYGVVTREGELATRMRERPEGPGPGEINGGVYWLDRDVLELIPPAGAVSLEREVFPAAIARGALKARAYAGDFVDIGVPQDYAAAQAAGAPRRGAVFFDRDGVLNEDDGYTHRVADFRWLPGAREAVRLANDRGLLAFVVTNQAGVARGFYAEEDVRILHAHMQAELAAIGAHIDDLRFCPHHPEGAVAAYRRACSCRKPGPGMILDLCARWPVDLSRSLFLGDRAGDLEAAAAASLRGVLVDGSAPLDAVLAAAL